MAPRPGGRTGGDARSRAGHPDRGPAAESPGVNCACSVGGVTPEWATGVKRAKPVYPGSIPGRGLQSTQQHRASALDRVAGICHPIVKQEAEDRLSKITWEIVHVHETREQLDRENEPLQIEYNEVKIINGSEYGVRGWLSS
jgi:hypothetical protein